MLTFLLIARLAVSILKNNQTFEVHFLGISMGSMGGAMTAFNPQLCGDVRVYY